MQFAPAAFVNACSYAGPFQVVWLFTIAVRADTAFFPKMDSKNRRQPSSSGNRFLSWSMFILSPPLLFGGDNNKRLWQIRSHGWLILGYRSEISRYVVDFCISQSSFIMTLYIAAYPKEAHYDEVFYWEQLPESRLNWKNVFTAFRAANNSKWPDKFKCQIYKINYIHN